MAQIKGELTEEKILEAMRAEGITNLNDLARKAVEDANARTAAEALNYFYTGVHYSWSHPE